MRITMKWAAALAAIVLARPAAVDACTGPATPAPGLNLTGIGPELTIAGDGVLVFDAYALQSTPEQALESFSIEVTRDGVAVAGGLEVVPLWTGILEYAGGVETDALPLHEFLIVWRPEAAWMPGVHAALIEDVGSNGFVEEVELTVTVEAQPGPAIVAPEVHQVFASEFVAEVLERVCCEQSASTCGNYPYCKPTQVRHETGLNITAGLAEPQHMRGYLWVAGYVDGEVGTRVPAHAEFSYYPPEPSWTRWADFMLFDVAPGEQCVVIGATSLIDGSSVMSEPMCATVAAPREEMLTPMFAPQDPEGGMGDCLSPPVYEKTGEAYEPYDAGEAPEKDGGCRVGGSAPWGLLAFGLLWRRRGRRVSGK